MSGQELLLATLGEVSRNIRAYPAQILKLDGTSNISIQVSCPRPCCATERPTAEMIPGHATALVPEPARHPGRQQRAEGRDAGGDHGKGALHLAQRRAPPVHEVVFLVGEPLVEDPHPDDADGSDTVFSQIRGFFYSVKYLSGVCRCVCVSYRRGPLTWR